MANVNYKELLAQLRNRLSEVDEDRALLEVRRTELDNEAANIKATIAKLLPLSGEPASADDLSQLGFTHAILKVIELARPSRLTAQQIKEKLAEKGFELSSYTNPMASIYKILSRLEEGKKIEVEREGFNSFYKARRRTLLAAALRRRRLAAHATAAPPPSIPHPEPTPTPVTHPGLPPNLKGIGGLKR